MSKGMSFAAVIVSALIGAAIGVFLANWRFGGGRVVDPEVLLAARILAGGAGALLFGYLTSWKLQKRAVQ